MFNLFFLSCSFQCTPFPPPFLHNPLNSMHLEVTVYPPHIFTAPLSLMTLVCIQLGSQHPSKHTLITRLWRKEVFGMSGGGGAMVSANPTPDSYPLPSRHAPSTPPLPPPSPPPGVDIFLLGGLFICNPVSHDSPPPSALHSDCLS